MAWTSKRTLAAKTLLILVFAGLLSYFDSTTDLKLGLDLKGGTQLDYSIDLSEVALADQKQLVEGVKEVIRRRVDSLGVAEPSIYDSKVGDEFHVIVELAGVQDLEEAKAIVGKTIQLEFREEEPNPDNSKQVAWANEAAKNFLSQVNAGENFQSLGEKERNENKQNVQFTAHTGSKIEDLPADLQTAIEGKSEGSLVGPLDLTGAYTVNSTGNLSAFSGTGLIQVGARHMETEEKEIPETVSARHILVSWNEINEEQTRSKEEALARIQEVQNKLAEGQSFEELAKEYSEDPGSKDKGGDLGAFGRGAMVEAFEETAFSTEVGQISEPIESDFGYHLIQVYDKQEAATETVEIEKIDVNSIIWNTTADPWKEEAVLTGEHFEHADVQFNGSYQPFVSITFDEEGGKIFEELTGRNINKSIAIFVGGELISAPTVQAQISGGQAQISGSFTIEEAQELARDLNTGAIPAPVELVGQHNISATLGEEALNQSLHAGLIGVLVLALFMILYYRLPGLIASVALAIYSALLIFVIKSSVPVLLSILVSLGIFSYLVYLILKSRDSLGEKCIAFVVACFGLFFLASVLASPITLTLAGIAGVVLSIGMAVDANILIFERMKEELREGRTLHSAIDEGFKRAWESIRDSNFSSLITCGILFYFGSSIIRGFAANLALGILVSMFSAILLTRTLLLFTAESGLSKKMGLWGSNIKKEPKPWPIMKFSGLWTALSGLLAVVAIVAVLIFGVRLGLDFTGGTSLEVKLNNPEITKEEVISDVEAVASALGEDLGSPQVLSNDEGHFIIRLKHISEEDRVALMSKFKESSPNLEEIRFTTVGPVIGDTLKQKAALALGLTSIMIVLYIAFAFRRIPKEVSPWRFGMSAIVALIHDVLIVFGVFVVLGHYYGVEMDALFITALLTIMGFSVHDTIVVFDRIRENLRHRSEKETLMETANKALNQTLARSINTSISTLITIVAMLILGPESIRMFLLALTVGIVAGTYSSIFIASPLMVWWNNWAVKRR
ncbi:protein translocase subunit SecF [Candidatus Peregrinibacteria bacterium]|nr:MAG: protein translocase subunit SecF [Candidatus Peregrinibacteria bacterium]